MTYPAERYLKAYAMALQWCDRVERCLAQLPERERILLEAMIGVTPGVTLDDIQFELSISKSGAYRIRRRALRNIWHLFLEFGVPLFWDDKVEHMCYNRGE